MKMTGAQILMKILKDENVDTLFGFPGGAVIDIYDELARTDIRHILVRHEQGAVHAADGYARASGKVGVCLVTSGPGATNTVTGIASAYADSIPIVVLTGQVPTHLIGNDAFQEVDIVGITRSCTKHNYLVESIADLARILKEAFYLARSGRPGPVLVDIPKNIASAKTDFTPPGEVHLRSYNPTYRPNQKQLREVGPAPPGGRAPADLCRRGRDPLRGCGRADAPGAGGPHPRHDLADGPGRVPGLGSALSRDDRDARHLRGQHECIDLRPHAGRRRALRRPRDRENRRVRAPGRHRAHRHRSDLDPQEHPGQRAPRRRLPHQPADVERDDRDRCGRCALPCARRVARPDRGMEAGPAAVVSSGGVHQAPAGRRKSVRADPGRGDHHHRGRPEPDVGRPVLPVRSPQPLHHLRRAGLHGLRAAGGHRRPDRLPGQGGGGHRRRRQHPDEHPGDGHRRPVRPAHQDRHPQQRLPRHGAPVAGAFLRPALQRHPHESRAGLRQAGRGVRRGGPAGDPPRGGGAGAEAGHWRNASR